MAQDTFVDFDRQVINDLLDAGTVDTNVLVRVMQLMSLPEFDAFFDALCQVGLGETSQTAQALLECATSLERPDVTGVDNAA